jgi:hypothetical protein
MGVAIMRSKILTGAAAFAITTTAGLAITTPASAHYAHWSTGNAVTDIAAGVIGGAFAAATSPFWATDYGYYGGYPAGYAYGPSYVYEPGYAYMPGYSYGYGPGYSYGYAPGYSYGYYGSYGWWHPRYRGGPHPR